MWRIGVRDAWRRYKILGVGVKAETQPPMSTQKLTIDRLSIFRRRERL